MLDKAVEVLPRSWIRRSSYIRTTSSGLQEPFVQFEIIRPGQTFQSKCDGGLSISSDHPNAFYCPVEGDADDSGMVILPVQRTGDFAAGVITAHEFGHHVVDSLATQVGRAQPQKPNSELIADCFAGVWADSVRLEDYLEEGDIDEGLEALAVIGDDTGDHGTGPERDNAFNIGLNGTQAEPGGGEPRRMAMIPIAPSTTPKRPRPRPATAPTVSTMTSAVHASRGDRALTRRLTVDVG